MGAVVTGAGKGEGGFPDARTVLYRGGTGGNYIWVGDVGDVTAHRKDAGRILPQGDMQVDGLAANK